MDDFAGVKLFRNMWLYCGMLGLAGSALPEGWYKRGVWREALGLLAAATPVLIYGSGAPLVAPENAQPALFCGVCDVLRGWVL